MDLLSLSLIYISAGTTWGIGNAISTVSSSSTVDLNAVLR